MVETNLSWLSFEINCKAHVAMTLGSTFSLSANESIRWSNGFNRFRSAYVLSRDIGFRISVEISV